MEHKRTVVYMLGDSPSSTVSVKLSVYESEIEGLIIKGFKLHHFKEFNL